MSNLPTGFESASPTRRLGKLGVWSNVDHLAGTDIVAFAQRVESLGFDALWMPEGAGREPLAVLGALAMATDRLVLGAGIASIYARDAMAAHAGALTIGEISAGRFVLGLGVSHPFRVEGQRGHVYLPPLPAMNAYLDSYEAAVYQASRPSEEPALVLAALRRRMLELAARRADGAFPFFVPVDYVARARATLDRAAAAAGKETRPLLIVAVPTIMEAAGVPAREVARRYADAYLRLPNYRNNLAECGFEEADLIPPGSDRLVDAIVARGTGGSIRNRINELWDAGADHVAAIPIGPDGRHANIPLIEAIAS